MSKVFFIADTHFGDSAILRYENRPFESTAHMDRFMVDQWNAVVSSTDTVYVLGDFGAEDNEASVLKMLNGTKYLVKGNHDIKSNEVYRKAGFAEVYDHPIILDDFWMLSHEPLYVNQNMPFANLFGHIHGSPLYADYSQHHFCVTVERINYAPIAFDIIKEKMKERASEQVNYGNEKR